jgi:MATE family multidrug resistance protein
MIVRNAPFSAQFRSECAAVVRLTVPVAAATVAQMLMTVTDRVFMGHIDTLSLAGGDLAASVAMALIIAAQGLIASMQPMIAQSRGSGDMVGAAAAFDGGTIIALIASLPIVSILLVMDRILIATGQPPEVAAQSLIFVRAFVWGVPAMVLVAAIRNYLLAIERPRLMLVALLIACVINILLNWCLVFGNLGMPALGLAGSGYATSAVSWVLVIGLYIYTWWKRLVRPISIRRRSADLIYAMTEIISVGWPIAVLWAVEASMFAGSSAAMGHFGASALVAHAICYSVARLIFMVPVAIGRVAAVRVAFHMGADAPHLARAAGIAAMSVEVGFAALCAVSLIIGSRAIILLYVNPSDPHIEEVVGLGMRLMLLAALFQLVDGVQAVASGALRGLKDTWASMIAGLIGYWSLGLPIGLILAFKGGMGPLGIWWGFVVGLTSTAALLTLRFRRRFTGLIAARGKSRAENPEDGALVKE